METIAEGLMGLFLVIMTWSFTRGYYTQLLREERNDHQLTRDLLKHEQVKFENFDRAYGAIRRVQ